MSRTLCCLLGLLLFLPQVQARNPINPLELEALINQRLLAFPIEADNLFRLAAYAEMKGDYLPRFQALNLHFGDLGMLNIYPENCLLRSPRGVFHLDVSRSSEEQIQQFNIELAYLFEQIILLGNHNASPELVAFVDRHLARKNIEPFDKIFLRHILVKYGRFESDLKRVVFHTDWLPDSAYEYRAPGERGVVKRPVSPLMVKLDEHIVRGYYIRAGGTVYVEDVERDVVYATGEEYLYNVSAFKLFIQKLFVQTTHYVVNQEQDRLDDFEVREAKPTIREVIAEDVPQAPYMFRSDASFVPSPEKSPVRPALVDLSKVEPLYHHYNWIPMMLGLLRSRNVNIGDPDVIRYFVGKPYFDRVYSLLTYEEKRRVDAYLKTQNSEIRK